MTTEESMESLDRAVEEARADVLALMFDLLRANPARGYTGQQMPTLPVFYEEGVDALIEAVSAKARAEERERLVTAMVMAGRLVDEASLVIETALLPTDEPARSSEEAEVCLHPRVSRMAAVGGPIICGVCGEEAGG